MDRAENVHLICPYRLVPGPVWKALCREMNHGIRGEARKLCRYCRLIGDVDDDVISRTLPILRRVLTVPRLHDIAAPGQQVHKVPPDETACAGDNDAHRD